MDQFLWASWWLSLCIITGYYVYIFRFRENGIEKGASVAWPGVSIIIAVKNGSSLLEHHLPEILRQDYTQFEIIIVDDHSHTEESSALNELKLKHPRIILVHSDRIPGKKNALSLGIEKANHPLILCTDADCKPVSAKWIRSMVARCSGQNVVLGYSPYESSTGSLNLFIRFETVMTAMQYFSWAMLGRPYMGVGRNMLYPRKLFLESDPYQQHTHIPYGDDDLWIQSAMHKTGIDVCLEPDSFVTSLAAGSWKKWFRQKHRHMSAGSFYTMTTWWQPALFGGALIWHWLFFIPIVAMQSFLWPGIFFLLALCIRWYTYIKWSRRLGDHDTGRFYPVLEIMYALYLVVVGATSLLNKKKTWN